ncbi:MAG: antA/AntB antirepressor family protein [Magnetococcales bacterium]|nr:antA/AntB antirepressor family protein [Magnetococcales bacterium]
MIRIGGEIIQTVNARDLHIFLDIGRDFSNWIKSRIDQGGFVDEIDYTTNDFSPNLAKNNGPSLDSPNLANQVSGHGGNRRSIDYFLSLDMAKHLAMMERNEKGKQARQYFIECEKKLKALPTVTSMVAPDPCLVADLTIARFVADSLRISDAGQIAMYGRIAKIHHRPSTFLPDYTDEQITKSLSELLKEHGSSLSAVKVNTILIALGILEEKTRPGTKGDIKKFKSLTVAGQKYGKNLISPQNERETQPHYYVSTFPELLDQINAWLLDRAA